MIFHNSPEAMNHYDGWEKGIEFILNNEKLPLKILSSYFKNTRSLIENNLIYGTGM